MAPESRQETHNLTDEAAHILVIDDDQRICELIQRYLSENGFRVTTAASAAAARKKMKSLVFDLITLDVMMPAEDGMTFIQSLSEPPPVLMLTALSKPEKRIDGLEAGADDYLSKPFEPKELLLRIQKLLNRAQAAHRVNTEPVKMGNMIFDCAQKLLTFNDQRIMMSTSEEALLSLLARSPGRVFSRSAIARHCALDTERAVDVRINRLRRKIETNPHMPLYLQTVRGRGYVLKPG